MEWPSEQCEGYESSIGCWFRECSLVAYPAQIILVGSRVSYDEYVYRIVSCFQFLPLSGRATWWSTEDVVARNEKMCGELR